VCTFVIIINARAYMVVVMWITVYILLYVRRVGRVTRATERGKKPPPPPSDGNNNNIIILYMYMRSLRPSCWRDTHNGRAGQPRTARDIYYYMCIMCMYTYICLRGRQTSWKLIIIMKKINAYYIRLRSKEKL